MSDQGTDLLSLLRREANLLMYRPDGFVEAPRHRDLLRKAADEIERLRAENDELKAHNEDMAGEGEWVEP